MTAGDVVRSLPAMVVLSMVAWRAGPMLRKNRGTKALWVTLAFLGFGLAFYSPPFYRWADHVTGTVTASALGELLGTLGAAAGVRTASVYRTGRWERWPRWDWILSAVTGLSVSVLLVAMSPVTLNPLLADSAYFWDSTWRSVVYWVPFLATLTSALMSSILVWWRYRRIAPRGSIRTGLVLVAAGGSAGLLFVAVNAATLVAWELRDETRWWVNFSQYGETATVLTAGALLTWGTSWEAISTRAQRAREWVWSSARIRDLDPLWRGLTTLYPEVTIPGVDRGRFGRFALLRQVVEIRDALMTLSDNLDGQLVDAATTAVDGLSEGTAVSADIALVAVMVHAVAATGCVGLIERSGSGGVELPTGGGEDLAGEVAWLCQVAHAYRQPVYRMLGRDLPAELLAV